MGKNINEKKRCPNRAKQKGNRFPEYVQEKIERYCLKITELNINDSPEQQEKTDQIRMQLEELGLPVSSPTAEDRKTKKLTTNGLEDFLFVTGMSGKTFFEMCMKENMDLSGPDDENWFQITWPTEQTQRLYELLKKMPQSRRNSVLDIIRKLEPAYYSSFLEKLNQPSVELGREESKHPDFIKYEKNATVPKCIDVIGDRLRLTVEYIRNGSATIPKVECDQIGLKYNPFMTTMQRHYWLVFDLEDIWAFCTYFGICPHWLLLCQLPVTVLADNIETERLMDEFALLPKQDQETVIEYAEQISRRKRL